MKKSTIVSPLLSGALSHKMFLLAIAFVLCFCSGLYAGIKPANKKNGVNRSHGNKQNIKTSLKTAVVRLALPLAPPAISYASPQVYVRDTAIAPLSPTNTGGSVTVPPTTKLAPGIRGFDMAVDDAGNVYFSRYPENDVIKIPAGTTTQVVIASGLNVPEGVVADNLGNVFVAEYGNHDIKEIPVGGGPVVVFASGFTPRALAIDSAGNIYVAAYGEHEVLKIPAGGGTPVVLASVSFQPSIIAVDNVGNVYFGAGAIPQQLYKISPGGTISPFLQPFNNYTVYQITCDAAGNLFYSDAFSPKEVPANGSGVVSVCTTIPHTFELAVNPAGDVYVFNSNDEYIYKTRPGNYSIATSLPRNMFLDSQTGIISGTPYAAQPPTNYTITATNTAGSSSATVNIKVISRDDDLSHLGVNNGTLKPDFFAGTLNYTDYVSNAVTTLTITLAETDTTGASAITVNGAPVASGSSKTIPLSVGNNVITIVVTAPDGTSTQTYTLTAIRGPSRDPYLATLGLSHGVLSPTFSHTTFSYSTRVSFAISSITFTPSTVDSTATVKVNGTSLMSGTASASIPLNVGDNVIPITVTAGDGVTQQTYTITVNRATSPDTFLAELIASNGTLSPRFSHLVNHYTALVSNSVNLITVNAIAENPASTVSVNGTGSGYIAIPLLVGDNVITIVVTDPTAAYSNTYTVIFNRAPSPSTFLSSLGINHGILSPVFSHLTTTYTDSVENHITSVALTPTIADSSSTVTVNGIAVTPGTASAPIALVIGDNLIPVVVTSHDSTSQLTYTVTVHRSPSSNAYLTRMVINHGVLSPAFSHLTNSYSTTVAEHVYTVKIKPVAADTTARITVNGKAVASGSQTLPITLYTGYTIINTVVTAQDGTKNTYVIHVTREIPATNNFYQQVSVAHPINTSQLAEDGVSVRQGLSPNGDGINDFLLIDGITAYPENKLTIVNRSGQLVFEAENYDNNTKVFDGHSNKTGAMQLPGTYFYSLDYMVNDMTKHKAGFIVLKY